MQNKAEIRVDARGALASGRRQVHDHIQIRVTGRQLSSWVRALALGQARRMEIVR
ncbi:MAG TPA: hypothetical protein VGY99_13085 [Candidatus Binataceae bacterium]|nr:hypothetical protein [Candidatus Binataceae bacterium]